MPSFSDWFGSSLARARSVATRSRSRPGLADGLEDARELEARARPIARGLGAGHAPLVELGQLFVLAQGAVHALERVERVVEERVLAEELFERLAARRVVRHLLQRRA